MIQYFYESWDKMNKKLRKVVSWILLILMIGSVAASIMVYALI